MENENLVVYALEHRIISLYVKDFRTATFQDALDSAKIIKEYCIECDWDSPGIKLIEFGHGSFIEKEAREYSATKEANTYTHGAAILVNNLAQQLIGDYYLRFNHPKYPTKVFYKKEKAMAWMVEKLKNY